MVPKYGCFNGAAILFTILIVGWKFWCYVMRQVETYIEYMGCLRRETRHPCDISETSLSVSFFLRAMYLGLCSYGAHIEHLERSVPLNVPRN